MDDASQYDIHMTGICRVPRLPVGLLALLIQFGVVIHHFDLQAAFRQQPVDLR